MRKEAAYLLVVGVFCLGASSAQAAPVPLADWPFDEGGGQLAADVSGHASHGQLGATAGGDSADPAWIAGHDGGSALDFGGAQYLTVSDSGTLEPAHVAVDAWVRRSGTPGKWRYVLSKGSFSCDRSAYGLYSGWSGGMAFYVSSTTHYVISPEVSPSLVWDGAWHHVIGSYDGGNVRLWIDGSQVGSGTPTSLAIAYGIGSKGVDVGSYPGSCDLGFHGAIDDVLVWDDIPATAIGGPVIAPVPGTPTVVAVGGGSNSGTSGSTTTAKKDPGSSSSTRAGCLRVTLSRRTVPVKRRAVVVATVRRISHRVSGVRVLVRGGGVSVGASTNRKGTAKIVVRAHKRGRLTVRVRGQKTSCPAPTVRAR
jgi:concanavalin A-like lectin/glucanase superfamily protein